MHTNKHADDLALALELADAADRITTKHFRTAGLQVETKPDMTPVTEADKAVEQMIRDRLAIERPTDRIFGEEFGGSESTARTWIIDPIDGTKNYAHGNPVYATLIALKEKGQLIVAVASAPHLNQRWWASRGGGAWNTAGKLQVSTVKKVHDAYMIYGSLGWWQRAGKLDTFLKFHDSCYRQRAFGDFWMYMLVAEGAADIAIEPGGLKPWDIAAPQLIVEEAGGTVTNLLGKNDLHGSVLATNGQLHTESLALLQ